MSADALCYAAASTIIDPIYLAMALLAVDFNQSSVCQAANEFIEDVETEPNIKLQQMTMSMTMTRLMLAYYIFLVKERSIPSRKNED